MDFSKIKFNLQEKSRFKLFTKKLIESWKQQLIAKYSGIPIVFAGDFRQLDPVGRFKKPMYAEIIPDFKDKID